MSVEELVPLVTLTATITIASVNIYLAYVNKKSLKEVMKERKRSRIVELLKHVITPLITKLHNEITHVQDGNFGYKCEGREIQNLARLDETFEFTIYKQLYYDLKRKHPKLEKKIKQHDALYLQVSKKVGELYQAIHNEDFIHTIDRMIDEYGGWEGDRLPSKFVAEWLTNSFIPTAWGQRRNAEFYDRNREKFEKIMERKGVLLKREDLKQVSNGLIKVATSIKEDLEHIREKYREEYDLLAEEVYEMGHPKVEEI